MIVLYSRFFKKRDPFIDFLSTVHDEINYTIDVNTTVEAIKELEDVSQRLEVAKLLKNGKNYQEISKLTGASTATISRVNKCLNYGKGGYNLVLDKKDE